MDFANDKENSVEIFFVCVYACVCVCVCARVRVCVCLHEAECTWHNTLAEVAC